jgi:hypothetical protein
MGHASASLQRVGRTTSSQALPHEGMNPRTRADRGIEFVPLPIESSARRVSPPGAGIYVLPIGGDADDSFRGTLPSRREGNNTMGALTP